MIPGFYLASLFHAKARKWVEGRKSLPSLPPAAGKTAWFHCASVGEFEQARPVLEAFREKYPGWRIVLTFFSPSGYELRKQYDQADYVLYMPADTPAKARQFLDAIRPDLVFWVKYEFWYHHLAELRRRGIPAILFSAIFRPDQIFFKSNGGFYREILGCFTHLFVQNRQSQELLKTIGFENVTTLGDTRFDRVLEIAEQARTIEIAERFAAGRRVLIGGSLWPEDWEVLREADLPGQGIRLILAPHEINPAQIRKWMAETPYRAVRYSETTPETVADADILWIDNVGMLASLYRYGQYAFIGGGYKDGLHNILEAAVWGMPVFFGNKKYRKFQEALDLLEAGSAHAVADARAFRQIFDELSAPGDRLAREAQISRDYVREQRGATAAILAWTETHLMNKHWQKD